MLCSRRQQLLQGALRPFCLHPPPHALPPTPGANKHAWHINIHPHPHASSCSRTHPLPSGKNDHKTPNQGAKHLPPPFPHFEAVVVATTHGPMLSHTSLSPPAGKTRNPQNKKPNIPHLEAVVVAHHAAGLWCELVGHSQPVSQVAQGAKRLLHKQDIAVGVHALGVGVGGGGEGGEGCRCGCRCGTGVTRELLVVMHPACRNSLLLWPVLSPSQLCRSAPQLPGTLLHLHPR